MASAAGVGGHERGGAFGNSRKDAWWVGPGVTLVGLLAWLIYYFWASWQGEYYAWGPYISPFYAPLIFADAGAAGVPAKTVEHAFFGAFPAAWPGFIPRSPALLIGFLPGMFRVTCYYYRKAYYRAFFGTPPGCAVNPAVSVWGYGNYRGETLLLIWQNLHRYTLYIAIALLPFLFYEAWNSLWYEGEFGIGVGSVVLWVNGILLSCYTLGCHAWRHLVGGRLNCFSCDGGAQASYGIWKRVSWLNARHMQFAWMSLYWILFGDIYIRLVSMGVITDINTWGI